MLADTAQTPCPECGSTDVDRTPAPSTRGHGEERITSNCGGCGADRGEDTHKMKGRPKRKDPVSFPKNNGEFNASLEKTATPSPQQIKEACWSKGFFELMASVFGSRGNDPVHGACRLVMEALHIIFPQGEKVATINDRGDSQEIKDFYRTHQPMVQHYALKVGGQYLDGNGAHSAHELTTDEDLGGWRTIPNLIIPATQALIDGNRGIACPPGAAQKAADYILAYKG